jgi:hypothetical protein
MVASGSGCVLVHLIPSFANPAITVARSLGIRSPAYVLPMPSFHLCTGAVGALLALLLGERCGVNSDGRQALNHCDE